MDHRDSVVDRRTPAWNEAEIHVISTIMATAAMHRTRVVAQGVDREVETHRGHATIPMDEVDRREVFKHRHVTNKLRCLPPAAA